MLPIIVYLKEKKPILPHMATCAWLVPDAVDRNAISLLLG
jgi:hypothetical protein